MPVPGLNPHPATDEITTTTPAAVRRSSIEACTTAATAVRFVATIAWKSSIR